MGTCCPNQSQQTYEDNGEHEDIEESEDCDELSKLKGLVKPDFEVVENIDDYLLSLYENDLTIKRSEAEVKCITSAVKNIVEKLMTTVTKTDPTFEISKQYLVGSMAEGTSIMEPNEFDFLVTLKHCFSNQSFKSIKRNNTPSYLVTKSGEPLKLNDLSTVLGQILSSLHIQSENSYFGKLSIKSTTVCCHGPASVIKLLWQPLSKTSKPLDILVDITPCIELQGIYSVIQASDVAIPAHYEAMVKDDIYFLIQQPLFDRYVPTFTTTELKIVQHLSELHKLCYMILKYCLNDIILEKIYKYKYQSPFSSYIIKSFVLRHAARCQTITTDKTAMSFRLYQCLVDILRDLQRNIHEGTIDGIFGNLNVCFSRHGLFAEFSENVIHLHIENTIQMLVHIGKQGNTLSNNLKFRKICQRDSIHSVVRTRAKRIAQCNVECHLSHNCKIHNVYERLILK